MAYKHSRGSVLFVSAVIVIALIFSAVETDTSYAAPKKKPLVAVGAMYASNAKPMMRTLKKWGFRVKWVKTTKINVNKYDGLVLPGGGDVTPSLYGAKRHKKTYNTRIKRDRLQIALVKKFAKKGKPVLGVCRGLQVINVAYGGTLKQHIGTSHWNGKKTRTRIAKNSWSHKVYGKARTVKCYHHQCIKKLGKGLVATQWSVKDKRIEAIKHKSLPIYGVQYHIDEMGKTGYKVAYFFKKECLKHRK